MQVELWPIEESRGQVRRFLKHLEKHDHELYGMVDSVITTIERNNDLSFLHLGYDEKLPGSTLRVLKIPPKGRSEGVARLYYQYMLEGDGPGIIIFASELKHNRKKDDQELIDKAERYYHDYCISKKKGRR